MIKTKFATYVTVNTIWRSRLKPKPLNGDKSVTIDSNLMSIPMLYLFFFWGGGCIKTKRNYYDLLANTEI